MRVDPEVLDALRRWARDDLRSVNAQVEFILRRALMSEGRLEKAGRKRRDAEDDGSLAVDSAVARSSCDEFSGATRYIDRSYLGSLLKCK